MRLRTLTTDRLKIGLRSAAVAAALAAPSLAPLLAQEPGAPADSTPSPVDTPTPDPRPDDPEFDGIAGRIVEVGDRALVVLENNTQQKMTVRVPAGADIKLNREQAALSHLRPGDTVRITVAAKGSNLAREVLVARLTPNSNPRPAPPPQPAHTDERVDVGVSETRRNVEAGMGLVVSAGPNGGVLVVDAQDDSPAASAGLRPGDVLISFQGDELLTPQEFVTRVRQQRPGEKVDMVVMRGGHPNKGQVSLVRREAAPDVIIRRPAPLAGQVGAVNAVAPEAELEVSAGTPATVPAAGAVAGQPAASGNMQQIERTLQVLIQEIRALRQELRGNAAGGVTVPRTPAAPQEDAAREARQNRSRKANRQQDQ